MIANEFKMIIEKLMSVYRGQNFLQTETEQRTWYGQLQKFDFQDVDKAVNDWISYNKWPPTPSDILTQARRYQEGRKQAAFESNFRQEKLVHCPHCNDRGLIVTVSPSGIYNGRPCTFCPKGREKYPWYFLTDEEKEASIQEEERQGRRPPRDVYETPEEDWLIYNGYKTGGTS